MPNRSTRHHAPVVCLRNPQLAYTFIRQDPIGYLSIGLYGAEARQVAQSDDIPQADPEQAAFDSARVEWLAKRGVGVLRPRAWRAGERSEGDA